MRPSGVHPDRPPPGSRTSGDGDGAPGGTGGGVGGEGGSGAIAGAGGAGGAVEMPIDVSATGRVGLGTIGGATIEVFAYDDTVKRMQHQGLSKINWTAINLIAINSLQKN